MFIGIFGIESKEKQIRILNNIECKFCQCLHGLALIKRYTFFHFFFIPLFRWNEQYFLVCKDCNAVYEISKEKGMRLEKGEENVVTYWDLNAITHGNKCGNCGRNIESGFEYCPYCGRKI